MLHLIFLALFWPSLVTERSTLLVEVVLDRAEPGSLVRLALCKGEAEYKDVDRCMGRSVAAEGATVLIEFNDLPPGEYAIKALHDLNSNGRMDMNFLGIPQEPYAFSNDPKVMFAEPSFSETSFKVAAGRSKIRITMKG